MIDLKAAEALAELGIGVTIVEIADHLLSTTVDKMVSQTKGSAHALPAQDTTRSFQCNWGKRTQTLFCVSIRLYFQIGKSDSKTWQNEKRRMVRPWVELEKDRCELLKELREKTGRPVSGMIREAVTNFVRKKDYSISIGASHLPRKARENYRRVTTYLSASDLSLLASISKETGRCKNHLIREAVDDYLSRLP